VIEIKSKSEAEKIGNFGTELGMVELEKAEKAVVGAGVEAAAAKGNGRIVSTGVAEGTIVNCNCNRSGSTWRQVVDSHHLYEEGRDE
jgi:deoxycytidylate deaminase